MPNEKQRAVLKAMLDGHQITQYFFDNHYCYHCNNKPVSVTNFEVLLKRHWVLPTVIDGVQCFALSETGKIVAGFEQAALPIEIEAERFNYA